MIALYCLAIIGVANLFGVALGVAWFWFHKYCLICNWFYSGEKCPRCGWEASR